MTSRCQRCGSGCDGQLCSACQEFMTALQALEMRYSVADPRRQGSGHPPGPPAVVVETLNAAGYQLHRLGRRAGFYCVTCRERKRDNRVATTKGDWKQTVCYTCYTALTKKRQEQAKKPAKRTVQPGQASQRLPKNVTADRRSRQNGTSPASKTTERQQQPVQRPSGIGSLIEFLRAAGADARIGPTGYLFIDGSQVESSTEVAPTEAAEWPNIVNKIALTYLRGRFTEMVDRHARIAAEVGAALVPWERGVAIMRGDERLGGIYPAYASIPDHQIIYANFLTAGPHWQQVAGALRDAEARRAAKAKKAEARKKARSERRKASQQMTINQLPADVGPELIAACRDASRRIRLERRLDYGDTPVVLDYDAGELTLLPVTGPPNRLLVPFRLSNGTQNVTGELILNGRDLLPVRIYGDVTRQDGTAAWICALLGFADATCVNLFSAEKATRHAPSRPRRRPRTSASRPRTPARILPIGHRWPSYLEPADRHTACYVDSLVRGHRRRLPQGHSARDDALDRARQIGIILRPGETWVQPHIRGHGLPRGSNLRFLWHAPAGIPSLGN